YAGVVVAFGSEALRTTHLHGGALGEVLVGGGLVLASAVAYAAYIVLSGETVGRFGALTLTGWASGAASVLCIAQFVVLRPHLVAAPASWMTWRIFALSIVNATVCTAMPMWMVMRGIETIGSSRAAQIGMVGPISTLLLAVVVLGEAFTLPMLGGTV